MRKSSVNKEKGDHLPLKVWVRGTSIKVRNAGPRLKRVSVYYVDAAANCQPFEWSFHHKHVQRCSLTGAKYSGQM